ncbi:MAG: YraN family protein [Clostridium sp.]
MKFFNKIIGNKGEDLATKYLQKNNYKIICRNFSCHIGEIDIIAKKHSFLCFIEVKTRNSNYYGAPSEAVNYYKKRKLIKTAQYYMLKKNFFNYNIRFDVIEIILNQNPPYLNFIENAFIFDGYI